MKKMRWQLILGAGLIALSALIYLIHHTLFHDSHHIFMFLVGDIAFVPIEVLMVTLIIHRLLAYREKRSLLRKLNMVIGSFFSEVGTSLLGRLKGFHQSQEDCSSFLNIDAYWVEKDFHWAADRIKGLKCGIRTDSGDLNDLRGFLVQRREFILRLLGNPNLMEHEQFTDLLWAVYHLTDELMMRDSLDDLTGPDVDHISLDMDRTWLALLAQWLTYMNHLRVDYPYLYSLALRTNPFNPDATVQIQ